MSFPFVLARCVARCSSPNQTVLYWNFCVTVFKLVTYIPISLIFEFAVVGMGHLCSNFFCLLFRTVRDSVGRVKVERSCVLACPAVTPLVLNLRASGWVRKSRTNSKAIIAALLRLLILIASPTLVHCQWQLVRGLAEDHRTNLASSWHCIGNRKEAKKKDAFS